MLSTILADLAKAGAGWLLLWIPALDVLKIIKSLKHTFAVQASFD